MRCRRAGRARRRNRKPSASLKTSPPKARRIPDALYSLAVARFNTGDHLGAKLLFEDAERFAGSAHELINVARLRLNEWNYASAADLAQRAMLLDPNRHEVFEILGECALARKQPVEAYELGLEALRLSPGNRSVMRLLTRARARVALLAAGPSCRVSTGSWRWTVAACSSCPL